MNKLYESVQRWLIHENYSFNEIKTKEDNFKIIITDIGRDSGNLEIFEPKQQSNILVIGVKVQLKTNQMVRFLKLNEKQKENLEKKITERQIADNELQKLNRKGMILGETTVVLSVAILFFAALLDAGI